MGSWGGVAQTNIRKLIGFSSIINIGWLLARTIVSFKLVVLYFTVYCLTLVPLVYTLYQTSTSYFSQMSSTGMTLPQNILI
jgi:NADH:ubiquinone oxidoreductase subunit 2 (subunit N)